MREGRKTNPPRASRFAARPGGRISVGPEHSKTRPARSSRTPTSAERPASACRQGRAEIGRRPRATPGVRWSDVLRRSLRAGPGPCPGIPRDVAGAARQRADAGSHHAGSRRRSPIQFRRWTSWIRSRRSSRREASRPPARATSASSPAAAYPVAVAADWLVSAWDQNAALHVMSPAMAAIEDVTAGGCWSCSACRAGAASASSPARRWRTSRPRGGSARGAAPRRLGRRGGRPAAARRRSTVDRRRRRRTRRSTRRCGCSASAREIASASPPTTRDGCAPTRCEAALARIAAVPTIVCSQAGNVNTGAFDPLGPIAELARRARRVAARRRRVRAVGARRRRRCGTRWTVSSAPTRGRPTRTSGSTCRTTAASRSCAHPAAHRAAMAPARVVLPARRRASERDGMDWTPEASRRARAVPIYAALESLGRDGRRRARRPQLRAGAADGRAARGRSPASTVLNDVVLNQVLVRFAVAGGRERHAGGHRTRAAGRRVLGGRHDLGRAPAMRISVSNWSTTARGHRSLGRVDRRGRRGRGVELEGVEEVEGSL